jgi:hypothetical protein
MAALPGGGPDITSGCTVVEDDGGVTVIGAAGASARPAAAMAGIDPKAPNSRLAAERANKEGCWNNGMAPL